MTILRFTKDELVEALEERRPWAEAYDAQRLVEHRKAEREFLAAFRSACREAAKWDYETAKEHYFSVDVKRGDQPSCPASMVAAIDRNLNYVKASRQKRYTVSDRGDWSRLFDVLTRDESIKSEMC